MEEEVELIDVGARHCLAPTEADAPAEANADALLSACRTAIKDRPPFLSNSAYEERLVSCFVQLFTVVIHEEGLALLDVLELNEIKAVMQRVPFEVQEKLRDEGNTYQYTNIHDAFIELHREDKKHKKEHGIFLHAVYRGDIETVKKLAPEGNSPLCVAAAAGRLSLVKWFLDHNADVFATNDYFYSPIHLTTDPAIQEILREAQEKRMTGYSPLERETMLAIAAGNKDAFQACLITGLNQATGHDDFPIRQEILQYGVKLFHKFFFLGFLNKRNKSGYTLFFYLKDLKLWGDLKEFADEIIASPKKHEYFHEFFKRFRDYPLAKPHLYSGRWSLSTVNISDGIDILKSGFNMCEVARESNGVTYIYLSFLTCLFARHRVTPFPEETLAFIGSLLQFDYDPNCKGSARESFSLLHLVPTVELAKKLIALGANVYQRDDYLRTPLETVRNEEVRACIAEAQQKVRANCIARIERGQSIDYFLRAGMRVDAEIVTLARASEEAMLSLTKHLFEWLGKGSVIRVKELLDAGMDANTCHEGKSCLQYYAVTGFFFSPTLLNCLLEYGANIHEPLELNDGNIKKFIEQKRAESRNTPERLVSQVADSPIQSTMHTQPAASNLGPVYAVKVARMEL